MIAFLLKNCDPEDVSDVAVAVERRLGVHFARDAFRNVVSFGDWCDVVVAAVDAQHKEGCTSQQAFYQVRAAMAKVLAVDGAGIVARVGVDGGAIVATVGVEGAGMSERWGVDGGGMPERWGVDGAAIVPTTKLEELFPRNGRRRKVRELYRVLGGRLGLLEWTPAVGYAVFGGYLIALVLFLFRWKIGLVGLGVAIVVNVVARRFANELCYGTVGAAARVFMRDHYHRARRDKGTVNRNEIVAVIKEIFQDRLHLAAATLTPDATFN